MPAAEPADWFSDPITDIFPLQPLRLYVQIALANARSGSATRAQSMRAQRADAWKNYRASIKGLAKNDHRRFKLSVFNSAWNQIVADVESSDSRVRNRGDQTVARKEWAYQSSRPFFLPGSRYAWSIDLIIQGEYDIGAGTAHSIRVVIEMYEFNWIEVDGKRVRNTPDAAYRAAAERTHEMKANGSRMILLAANARALVRNGD